MGWCIDYMKFFFSIILLIMLSSCAAKTSENCLSSSLSIWAENKDINITLNDNGCRYNIHKMPKNIWKIEVENGSFSSFTPKAEKEVKKYVPVIKKNNKEVLLFFAANGRLIQNGKSSFIYMQDNLSYMPERKAGYIENIICGDDNIIKSNGAVSYKISSLYNGQRYLDIYNVSLKKDYNHNNQCKSISKPATLRFPRRIRYFLNDDYNVYNKGTDIIISKNDYNSNEYLIDIKEEKNHNTQKLKLEFSNNLEVISSNITPNYASVILKGRYDMLKNISNIKDLKGSILKKIEINAKSSVTEIKIYKSRLVKTPFISVDKVDNNIIIYAGNK